MERKDLLRQNAKIIRKSLDINKISRQITSQIKKNKLYTNATNVMLFYPLKNEIDLLELLKETAKNFYFPIIKDDDLYAVKYIKEKGFNKGAFSINEPIGKIETNLSLIDIIIVPALSVDKNGHRLGYGKGFYDRFLQKTNKKTIKIVPIPDKLLVEKLIIEAHDIPVDFVITETQTIKCE